MLPERQMMEDLLEPLRFFALHPYQDHSAMLKSVVFLLTFALRATFFALTAIMMWTEFGEVEVFIRGLEGLSAYCEMLFKCCPFVLFKLELRKMLMDMDQFWPSHDKYVIARKLVAAYKYLFNLFFAVLALISLYRQEFVLQCYVPDFPYAENVLVWVQIVSLYLDIYVDAIIDLYFYVSCYFTKLQFDLLLSNLQVIDDCRNPVEVRLLVRKWRQHHSFLIGYTISLVKSYELYFLLKFLTYIILFCAFMIVSPNNSGNYTDPVLRMTLLGGQMCLMCMLASFVTETAELVANAVYSIKWYDWPVRAQKDLVLIIHRAQLVPKFTAFGIFTIDRTTITTVVQRAYSFFTVAKTLMDRKQISE